MRYDWWFSVVCPRSMRACDSIGGTGCVSALPLAPVREHFFAHHLTVMVKICTVEIIFPFSLAGPLIW